MHVAPLTPSQEAVWLATEASGCASLYNVPLAYRVRGSARVAALEAALSAVVARHAPLRTAVENRPDGLWAIEQPPRPVVLERLTAARDAVDAVVEGVVDRPLDVSQGQMMRGVWVSHGVDDATLALSIHHLAFDGWSESVLLSELGDVYSAIAEGREVALPPLATTFADLAERHRTALMAPDVRERIRVAGARWAPPVPPLTLPWDRPPGDEVDLARQGVVRRTLPPALCDATRGFGREVRATWFMVLLAGVHALLARHTGQADQVIGTVAAGRREADAAALIGCFVNTLPLRVAVEPGLSFRALVARVRQTVLAAMRDEDLPFTEVLAAATPRRDPRRASIVQSGFVLQNTPAGSCRMTGLDVTRWPCTNLHAKFEMMFEVEPDDAGWRTSLEFRTDLFEAMTAARLLEDYERGLGDAVAAPDDPLPFRSA